MCNTLDPELAAPATVSIDDVIAEVFNSARRRDPDTWRRSGPNIIRPDDPYLAGFVEEERDLAVAKYSPDISPAIGYTIGHVTTYMILKLLATQNGVEMPKMRADTSGLAAQGTQLMDEFIRLELDRRGGSSSYDITTTRAIAYEAGLFELERAIGPNTEALKITSSYRDIFAALGSINMLRAMAYTATLDSAERAN